MEIFRRSFDINRTISPLRLIRRQRMLVGKQAGGEYSGEKEEDCESHLSASLFAPVTLPVLLSTQTLQARYPISAWTYIRGVQRENFNWTISVDEALRLHPNGQRSHHAELFAGFPMYPIRRVRS
jgi:hypothetical protein